LWNSAIEFASRGKHRESLAEIDKIERSLKQLPCEFRLFKASLLHKLGRLDEALESYRVAHDLANTAKGWGYTDSVRAYLKCYAAAYGSQLQQSLSGHNDPSFAADFSSVQIQKIPRSFRRKFPFPLHPDWKKEN